MDVGRSRGLESLPSEGRAIEPSGRRTIPRAGHPGGLLARGLAIQGPGNPDRRISRGPAVWTSRRLDTRTSGGQGARGSGSPRASRPGGWIVKGLEGEPSRGRAAWTSRDSGPSADADEKGRGARGRTSSQRPTRGGVLETRATQSASTPGPCYHDPAISRGGNSRYPRGPREGQGRCRGGCLFSSLGSAGGQARSGSSRSPSRPGYPPPLVCTMSHSEDAAQGGRGEGPRPGPGCRGRPAVPPARSDGSSAGRRTASSSYSRSPPRRRTR